MRLLLNVLFKTILGVIVLFILFTFVVLAFRVSSPLTQEFASPEGYRRVYVHFNASEGGLTPYGYETYVLDWYRPNLYLSKARMFFSGHCGAKGPTISWLDGESLELTCESPQYIALQKKEVMGIKVYYQMGDVEAS